MKITKRYMYFAACHEKGIKLLCVVATAEDLTYTKLSKYKGSRKARNNDAAA